MSSGGLLDDQFDNCLVGSSGDYGLSFTLLGESVTYTVTGPPGTADSSSSITAVRVATADVLETDEDERTEWIISATDVSGPVEGDRITDDAGVSWGITRVAPQEGGVFRVVATHAREV